MHSYSRLSCVNGDRDESQLPGTVPFSALPGLQEPPAIFVGKQALVNNYRNVSMLAGPSFRIVYEIPTC